MERIQIKSFLGGSFPLVLPEPGPHPGFFAFSLHKAGSTLLFNLLREAMGLAGMPVVDIPGQAFTNGQSELFLDDSINRAFHKNGYAYIGWRLFPHTTHFPCDRSKNILLVRDPRDCLVSLYFSVMKSHGVPDGGPVKDQILRLRDIANNLALDRWVFEEVDFLGCRIESFSHFLLDQFRRYEDFLPAESTRIYRYEDVVFRKEEWLKDMLDYLKIELPESEVCRIAGKFDLRPDSERPGEHVRQVTPGNYKKHLQPETIDRLNLLFAEVLTRYGYDCESGFGKQLCYCDRRNPNERESLNSGREHELYAQEEEFQCVQELLPKLHPTFLDIGAEKGSFSMLCLNGGMSGVAFEPFPGHFDKLKKIETGGKFDVYPWAVDAEDHDAVFHIAVDDQGNPADYYHSLQKISNDERVHHQKEIEVKCRSLESLACEKLIPEKIGVLKTDTEGNDLRVLQGLGDLRPQIILCEFFTEGLYHGWEDAHPEKLIKYLEQFGYEHCVSFSQCGGNRSTRMDPESFQAVEWGNLMFFHNDFYPVVRESGLFDPSDESLSVDSPLVSEVEMLRKVCAERLELIEQLSCQMTLKGFVGRLLKKIGVSGRKI